ncbi:hypothetical protein LTR62_001758 [Meristemomyces frigidus]|uniref:HhH-GPD domain-containing protein n=1 Tax=Meristemomyces frigidus TaxID=1508187 RepID=A0AAN7TLJ7_9PEZI|nr:hypothetical protein LTR62_001758 [Meristemomyces frigidus]
MARTTRAAAAKAATAIERVKEEPQQLSSPPSTPAPKSKKRARKAIKAEDDGDVNDLPHNLGTALPTPGVDDQLNAKLSPSRKRARKAVKTEATEDLKDNLLDATDAAIKDEVEVETSPKKKTPKKANYGLTPGISPYPDYLRPTAEECGEVVRLLEKVHGKVVAPKAVPPPSLDVSGCGEVPSVIDALVRTRLSANTTNKNSSTAFQGLVKRFGVLSEGIGKGSVDWDAVRTAPQEEVFYAIERGGLADRKSKDIQAILQIAYEENQQRKDALTSSGQAPGTDHEPASEKRTEVAKAEKNIISLDHLHLLSTPDAINKMLSFPGIGPKTASCVALFCLQRPSFAVDTHVFRLCQYLGWVPKTVKKGQPKVDRNTTYSHCDARIPDGDKYALHQLLIKHGKVCPRCRAITGQGSAGWEEGCPIEHLVKRHGAKKGGISAVERKKALVAAGVEEDGEGDDESELSAVPDE